MSWTGKVIGAILGLIFLKTFWGVLIGAMLGHMYDEGVAVRKRRGGRARGPFEIGDRLFVTTFEIMGFVAKADGRVSEAEIAAARRLMGELRLNGEQIQRAIQCFTRGKQAEFDVEASVDSLRADCSHQPGLLRVFLELQVRAALEGADMQGAGRAAVQRVAELLDISRIEVAHMEAVLRIRRAQFGQRGEGPRDANAPPPPKSSMAVNEAYQILECDAGASDAEVAKAYRRQLSKHHPDKLKANGLPDSMLEHAKQRTQQIIEAYELIKARRGRAA
jgi:DnaJ like chaperone protein